MAPGLSRKTRRLFFYALLFIFILAAPLLIVLSYGWRLDLVTGEVARRGGIFVKSKTPRLSIFLNGSFLKETAFLSGGALLPEISPGVYLLRIEKEGFHPWVKSVEVEPALVTELRQLLLVPLALPAATSTGADLALLENKNKPEESLAVDRKNNLIQKTATSTRILASNVYAFGAVDANTVFFIDRNGFLARLVLPLGRTQTLGRPGFFLKEGAPPRFLRSPLGELAILDGSGGVFMLNASGVLTTLGGGVRDMSFDARGEKILLVKEYEIGVVWLRTNPYQPFQPAGTEERILGLDERIAAARWFYADNAHIVIQTKDGVFFTELDGRGGRNTPELVAGIVEKIAAVPELPNKIFYKKGKSWHTLEL